MLRVVATLLARTLFTPALDRFAVQQKETQLHGGAHKAEKLYVGLGLILRDVGRGVFPPTFNDQAEAYRAEQRHSDAVATTVLRPKPFWGSRAFERYTSAFGTVLALLEQHCPSDARILELGCGMGWMSAWLARAGYTVVGTSISTAEIETAKQLAAGVHAERSGVAPTFRVAPMECVDEAVQDLPPFDAVFVYEALHHAFDWRAALGAASRCLAPGGALLICAEPNVLHTAISYRVGQLTGTHEIGMRRNELLHVCRGLGLEPQVVRHRLNTLVSPHWIVARKPHA